jgi:hypothetical protein
MAEEQLLPDVISYLQRNISIVKSVAIIPIFPQLLIDLKATP